MDVFLALLHWCALLIKSESQPYVNQTLSEVCYNSLQFRPALEYFTCTRVTFDFKICVLFSMIYFWWSCVMWNGGHNIADVRCFVNFFLFFLHRALIELARAIHVDVFIFYNKQNHFLARTQERFTSYTTVKRTYVIFYANTRLAKTAERFSWCEALGLSTCEGPLQLLRGKNGKMLIKLR